MCKVFKKSKESPRGLKVGNMVEPPKKPFDRKTFVAFKRTKKK